MIERKTTLYCVLDPTALETINEKAFVSLTRPLGTGVNSVSKMIACAEEMEFLLPSILGISPNSNSTNWAKAVSDYWHNFGMDVSMTNGVPFDITLTVDLYDTLRKQNIATLLKELKCTETSSDAKIKAVEEYLKLETTPETEKYKWAIPNNTTDYLAWRYCLVSGAVANDPKDVGKSTKIKFYLMDEGKAEQRKIEASKIKNKAMRMYSSLIAEKDKSAIDNILIAAESVRSLAELKKSDIDKENILLDMTIYDPAKFIALLEDKQLAITAEVKKWSMASLVNNIPNSTIYVDNANPTIVLGNTMSEVITYLSNPINAAYVNEVRIKFNALK